MFGTSEIIILVIIILILFGSAIIPKFSQSLGKAKNEYEKEQSKETDLK